MSDSMWNIPLDEQESTKPVFDLINEQIEYLSKKTDGKVIAALEPAKKSWEQIAEGIRSAASFLTGAYPATHHNDAKDASELYKKSTYEFYIMEKNRNYELSVFQITCNDSFPVTVVVEPSIAEEAEMSSNRQVLGTNKEFERVFREIIQTNKVSYIISRLIKLPSE